MWYFAEAVYIQFYLNSHVALLPLFEKWIMSPWPKQVMDIPFENVQIQKESQVKSDRISHILKRWQWLYLWNLHHPYFIILISADRTSEPCSAAWWTLAFQTHIRGMQYAFSLILVLGYYSCSMVDPQFKFTSKSFWSEQLLSAMVNSRFCVSAALLMLAGRCSLAS